MLLHNNCIYGLTKKQASPTSPRGLTTNTSPRGAYLDPINPLETTLGMANVSFVAHAADWLPGILHQILEQAFHHRGLSFVIIMQRCPNYLPHLVDRLPTTPSRDALPPQRANPRLEGTERVRDLLVGCGLDEVITYSLVPFPPPWGGTEGGKGLRVLNPLSAERAHLRQTLPPSLLYTTRENLRFLDRFAVFEIGAGYLPV